ncbi:hypothetical protein LPJ61_003284, partial [Coemansia biformis]
LRTRKAPPEREIDRFGVLSRAGGRGAGARDVVPLPRARTQTAGGDRADGGARPARAAGSGVAAPPRSHCPAASGRSVRSSTAPSRPPATARGSDGRRRRVRDDEGDESEYDSMDDFIVDDDEDGADRYRVGSIREMLGVRYHDVNDDDDDDDNMEVSATQVMREDRRSARIGRLEDEEEERRMVEEERRRRRRHTERARQ